MKQVRVLLIAFAYLLLVLPALAQAPRWQGASSAQPQPFAVAATAADHQGNTYYTGRFTGTITVGNTQLTSISQSHDLIVAKYDAGGRPVWATSLGAAEPAYPYSPRSSVEGYHLSVNPLTGEAYVVGELDGRLGEEVPGDNLPADIYQRKMLILKLSAAGQIQWTVQGSANYAPTSGNAIVADAQGNCYVTGITYGLLLSDGNTIDAGSRHLFVLSLSSAGQFRWGFAPRSTFSANGSALAVDGQNGLYVVGSYFGPLTIGGATLPSPSGTVLARINRSTGAVDWARGDNLNGTVSQLAADAQGNSYLTGTFTGTLAIDGQSVTAAGTEGFLIRVAANKTVAGVQALGAALPYSSVPVATLTTARYQSLLVALTRPTGKAAVLGLRPDGTPDWEEPLNGLSSVAGLVLTPGNGQPHGRALVYGSFTDQIRFGATQLTANGRAPFAALLEYRLPAAKGKENNALAQTGLNAYPNPAYDQLTLALPAGGAAQVQLVNMYGRVLHEQRFVAEQPATATLDVRRLPRGLYTLRVNSQGAWQTRHLQLD